MATFTYKHTVKVNGRIIPANTPIEVKDTEKTDEAASETPPVEETKKRTRKTKDELK